jgi:hypothetical protein
MPRKDYECKSDSVQPWFETILETYLGFFQGGTSPVCVTKPTADNPVGGLNRHGGSPAVSKTSTAGLGTVEGARGSSP